MAAYEIPLSPKAQTLNIDLGGVTYNLRIVWNAQMQTWLLDISDALGNALIKGIPMVTGIDLLKQYKYVGISGSLIVQTDHDAFSIPTFKNLGLTSRLFYVV